ncbi:MAG TPA: family 1 encapsulin nanocompartment shell protein [Verrucomicrobiae bacterium]|nr:family 1 encapsulin nanocompartment shell protein [Verrucomicrobiae bacterium]
MNNLHRELAPISDAAWSQIEDETTRTLKRYLAGRRVVDVPSPGGTALPGVATGHLKPLTAPAEGILARQREVKPLVELRVPFELSRQTIDDVERGSNDSNWQPAKDAAKKLAFAEDRAIFNGYHAAGIQGIREGTSNPINILPINVHDYPNAIARALSQLRLAGVNGPYSVVLGANEYTALAETCDQGYPVLEHVKRIVDGDLIWGPAIDGAFVLTTRGGDFALNVGQDVSIGYLGHTESAVQLYLQETFVFRVLTSEASVALSPSKRQNDKGKKK